MGVLARQVAENGLEIGQAPECLGEAFENRPALQRRLAVFQYEKDPVPKGPGEGGLLPILLGPPRRRPILIAAKDMLISGTGH